MRKSQVSSHLTPLRGETETETLNLQKSKMIHEEAKKHRKKIIENYLLGSKWDKDLELIIKYWCWHYGKETY